MKDAIVKETAFLENKRNVLLLEGEMVLLSLKKDIDSIVEKIKTENYLNNLSTIDAKLNILRDLKSDIQAINHAIKSLNDIQDFAKGNINQ
jgi:hypothetical protein